MSLFQNLKVYIVPRALDETKVDAVRRVLTENGARLSSYLTDSVSFLVADLAESSEVGEAREIYDIPVLTSAWVFASAKCQTLLPYGAPGQFFTPEQKRLFLNMYFCPSQVDGNTADVLWALITTSGGECERVITERTTHLVCPSTSGEKYRFAAVHERIKIIVPEWVFDCVKKGELVDEANYHPKDLLEPLSEEKDSGAAQAIQNLAATLKLEAQQLVERNQQNQYAMNQFSAGSFAPAKTNSIQEPSSPLVPLDPSRFRELVEKQQVATHQMQQSMMQIPMQQSQAPVSQQHTRQPPPPPMNAPCNSGMDQSNYVVMDSQGMAPHFQQQKVVPQYSPQVQSQQRFWFPSNTQVYSQRAQQQMQVQQQQMVQTQSQPPLRSPAYGTLVRMPQAGQVQNQRVAMISSSSQGMSTDGSLSSPGACPSPLGSPNQPMSAPPPPQQQQHMFPAAGAAGQQQSSGVYCHQVPVQFHQQSMIQAQQQQQQYVSQQQHIPQPKVYQTVSGHPPPHHVQTFRTGGGGGQQQRQSIMISSVPTVSRPMQSPSQSQRMVVIPSRYSPSGGGQNSGNYPSPVGAGQQSQQNKTAAAVYAMNSQMQQQQPQQQLCPQQQSQPQQQPPTQMQSYDFQQMNSTMPQQSSESPHYHGGTPSQQPGQQNTAFITSSMPPSPMTPQRPNSQPVPARYVNVTHAGMSPHMATQSPQQQQPPPQPNYAAVKAVPPPSYGHVSYQHQTQRFTHQVPTCSIQITPARQTLRQPPVHRPQKLQQQQHSAGFDSLQQAYRASPTVHQQQQQQKQQPPTAGAAGRGVQTFTIGRGGAATGAFGAMQQQVAAQTQASDVQKIKFYGHDPNLNVPPDYCLVGCVFLIVDYDRTLDQKEVSEWRIVIAQHGGDVETLYSNKCTHIVCESLRHPVVQQALKEGKRCVTAQWLNDVIFAKKMCPPWKAVHFPSTYGDNKPCKNKIITVCGFDLTERSCLKQMIVAIGARYTTYLSRHNHFLIAKCLEGEKVLKAVEWKIPIVNVPWLTELFLGQTSALQNINNAKYRQFIPKDNPQTLYDPFRIDAAMAAPVLMNSWRVPVPCTQETWKAAMERRQKVNSDDGKLSPYKKLKLSPAPNDDEIENHRKECMLNSKAVNVKVCFTGLYKAEAENLKKKFFWLGGNVVDHVADCTHLIAADLKRTKKLLEGISLGRFIVTPSWIRQSYEQRKLIDPIDYIVKDEGNEKFFGFNIKLSIWRARQRRLFENIIFYLTPSVQPFPSVLTDIIQKAGGSVVKQRPPLKRLLEYKEKGVKFVIITCDNDIHLCHSLIESGLDLHTAEFILTGILRQEVDYASYRIETRLNDVGKSGREL